MITPEELKRWWEIEEKATPGFWKAEVEVYSKEYLEACAIGPRCDGVEYDFSGVFIPEQARLDANFISHARNTYRQLLNEVGRLREALEVAWEHDHVYCGPECQSVDQHCARRWKEFC